MADHAGNPFYSHYEAGASSYESINNFKKDITREILKLCPPLETRSVVLDNACGPGIVTGEIQQSFAASNIPRIHAVDFSPRMIDELKRRATAEAWTNVEARVMDAQDLTFEDNSFTHSITNFGIFLFPDPVKAASEIRRTLRPGGVALVTTWHDLDWWLGILQHVQSTVRSNTTAWAGPFAEWLGTEKLKHVMLEGGFSEQELEVISVTTVLSGKDRDVYIEAMRPTWVKRATEEWNEDDRLEFDTQLAIAFHALSDNDTGVELVISVAIGHKSA